MLERNLQDYLFDNPAVLFRDEEISSKDREVYVEGRRVDLLFGVADTYYIVEVKRDEVRRADIGQIFEYWSLLRRSKPHNKYKMILVAPSIPAYRKGPLEEFGVRCVEIDPSVVPLSGGRPFSASTPNRKLASEVLTESPAMIRFDQLKPPVNQSSLQLSHLLLQDSLPAVQKIFSDYEVMPIRMTHPHHPDALCIPGQTADEEQIVRVGAWWAFAIGESEAMPKNDVPNLSINSMPWGLDAGINAELRTSQLRLRERIAAFSIHFDRLIKMNKSLQLQAWLKLEHQPRFYHWIPLLVRLPGTWNSSDVLYVQQTTEENFQHLREKWLGWIMAKRPELSSKQLSHMRAKNRKPNLAIRMVHSFSKGDALWKMPYSQQITTIASSHEGVKTLLQFFL